MKKLFLITAIAGLLSTNMYSQDDVRTRFGIKVAPNLSWTRSDTEGLQNDGNRLGYSIGLMAEFPLGISGNYRFASGLFLTTIGGRTAYAYSVETPPFPREDNTQRTTWNLRYLEIPLTIKMTTNEIGYLRYYGQLGLTTGINLRARADFENVTVTNNVSETTTRSNVDVQDNVTLFRAALLIGGGVEYTFSGQTTMLFGITYNNGILNVLDKDALTGLDRPKLLADYVELTLGIFF
jgi:hypothetical protein